MPAPSPRERPAFKQANLERCICRIREVRVSDLPIRQDHLKRDAIILNLHRALECLMGMGSYLVRKMKLDWSGDSAAVFDLLAQAGMLSAEQGARLQTLMSRRQPIFDGGLDVVEQVVENHLDEIIDTGRTLLRQAPDLAVELVPACIPCRRTPGGAAGAGATPRPDQFAGIRFHGPGRRR